MVRAEVYFKMAKFDETTGERLDPEPEAKPAPKTDQPVPDKGENKQPQKGGK
jgi:hypothetical protein